MNTLVQEIRGEVIANHLRGYEANQKALAQKILDEGVVDIVDFLDKASINRKITLSSETLTEMYMDWSQNR